MVTTPQGRHAPVLLAALLIGFLLACSGGEWVLEVDRETKVLEHPRPLDYTSSNPLKNSIIGTLMPGESVKVSKIITGKDFRAYQVQTSGGREGFVIHDGGVHIYEVE